jgi:hypothetical protein
MMLSRWRRVATGLAAGVIVLCAALLGGALRDDSSGMSVAADVRPTDAIPIPVIEPDEANDAEPEDATEADSAPDDSAPDDSAQTDSGAVDTGDTPAEAAEDSADDSATSDAPSDGDTADGETEDGDAAIDSEPVRVIDEEAVETPAGDDATDDAAGTDEAADGAEADPADTETESAAADPAPAETASAAEDAATPAPATEPLASGLGTGGGVDDAECALDRLVIYAGARRGGVAGSIRAALNQAGFGAGCAQPPVILASNCPLQFAGVLGPNSGYDPNKSFVAASGAVDRTTMTAVMGTVGYAGSEIDILDFSFVNPDAPGEQWMAIFVPPSFAGWETLANRAGVGPTSASLCGASGRLGG